MTDAPAAGVHTTCPYCGVGCGVVARTDGTIRGDQGHPSNRGRLCSKGAALAATLDDGGRLLAPTVDGQAVSWDVALDLVADRFRQTIATYGRDSVAFYVSGQCLTEDYYVANKLMKGFIGSGNIDTNSRLCMSSSVAGHVRAFGEDVVPGVYEDFEEADLVVLVGSNTAWCHPVLHQRLQAARTAHGTKVVVIDPRRTATAEAADLHLPLAIGSDVALFNGLLAYLDANGAVDHGWVGRHASGLEAALEVAGTAPNVMAGHDGWIEAIAAECGADPEVLETFYQWFAATERVMTVYSQGVNQSSAGTDKVNAIVNCHLATGRIGRPGMGPFSVTGQPNAMGGREVGGLANQLAAHMHFDDPIERAALREFWRAPNLTETKGLNAVDLFEAVYDGRIQAIWIVATNPADSLPDAAHVREALAACPFVVVSDCWATDTSDLAHVVLPAAAWGEKDGTVTSSERRISRQRPFREPPGEAKPDWWMFAQVACRLGHGRAFGWKTAGEVFVEHAALSGVANQGQRVFDISGLATLDQAGYDALQPVRWPFPAGAATEGGRLFAHGGFATPDGRARLVPTPYKGRPSMAGRPFLLNTGRVRDQWHTMTRTGLAPALMAHTAEPRLSVHPADAAAIGLAQDGLARITTDQGSVLLRADLKHTQRRGELFAPMHWTDRFASSGAIGQTVSALVDPISGQPELKATPAGVTPVEACYHGLLLRRAGGVLPGAGHWVRIPLDEGQLYRLTGLDALPEGAALADLARNLLAAPAGAEILEMADRRRGVLRMAAVLDGAVEACLFLARNPASVPPEAAVIPMLGAPVADNARPFLLAGRLYDRTADEGPRVCACFGVSRDAIRHAIVTHGLRTAAEIGALLKAGTNCGSCIPELQEILRDVSVPAA
jgi:assimilatory nitrate reductase catalytic subunit